MEQRDRDVTGFLSEIKISRAKGARDGAVPRSIRKNP
jgi:hypothetical protein